MGSRNINKLLLPPIHKKWCVSKYGHGLLCFYASQHRHVLVSAVTLTLYFFVGGPRMPVAHMLGSRGCHARAEHGCMGGVGVTHVSGCRESVFYKVTEEMLLFKILLKK